MASALKAPPERETLHPAEDPAPASIAPQRVRHRRFDVAMVALLGTSDVLMVCLAMVLAYVARLSTHAPWLSVLDGAGAPVPGAHVLAGKDPLLFHPLTVYLRVLPFVLPLWIFIAAQRGLYTPRRSVSHLTETLESWKGSTLAIVICMAAAYITKYDYSRAVTVLFWAFALVLTSAARYAIRRAQLGYLRQGHGTIRSVIYGTGEAAMMVVKKMQRYRELGYEVIGLIDDDPGRMGEEIQGSRVLGTSDDIFEIVRDRDVHEVFIAQPFLGHERILDLITRLESAKIRYRIVSDLLEALTSRIELDGIANIPIVDLKGRDLPWWEAAAKTVVDYAVTLLILIAALPVMAVIALLIKLGSPGPVIFRQERVGRGGRVFRIFKFRTMHVGCEKFEVAPANKDDARVTRVGRFLRRTSLDELPQLFNVLTGDMSLVGPRPEMPFLVAEYELWQKRRLDVKPGITGLWQILGRKDLPLHENLEYDFYYIQNRSLLWDIVIMVRTIPIVLFGRGAY
ncbi:MAG: sugar transferase [Acidobacteriota bacterium]